MTDKLKCCFCGAELNDYPDKTTGARMAVCRNPKCKYDGWHFPVEIIQQIITGEKARHALKEIKQTLDECFSSDKSGFTVFWDVIARRIHSVITDSTKQGE